MGIRFKLSGNIVLSVCFLAAIGVVGFFFINRVATLSTDLFEKQAHPIIKISDAEKTAWEILIRQIVHCAISDPDAMEKLEQETGKLTVELAVQLEEYDQLVRQHQHRKNGEAGAEKEASAENITVISEEWKKFQKIARQSLVLSQDYAKEDALKIIAGEGRQAFDRTLESIESRVSDHKKQMLFLLDNAVKARKSALMWIIGFTVFTGFISFLAGMWIMRAISVPVSRVVDGLRGATEQVASASEQVASSSQQLAGDSSRQAASLEQTSASLEEVAAMTMRNAAHAAEANGLMQETNRVVARANDAMTRLTSSMDTISGASKNTSEIIKTIDEIAFQTNLLALNAAVEAARAGASGAGFAVVAEEVRNLAMRSTEAARNTAELIDETIQSVSEGAELVGQTNETFSQVLASTDKVSGLVAEITTISGEQARGIEQVNRAVADMDAVVHQNVANTEESASVAEEMYSQSKYLGEFVTELVALVAGKKRAGAA
ncbi:hypothetical protein DENIS_1248 [Desulfonema ishimotonii]|uniref:Methyl-accepting transducer domain-containing protein n=1 Tax=Desulfonema ishimotonii TaxID=45657 RepID=A0A401FTJ2_9BACT|nr:methyl-accepting chemotaxis protein [Desulfonema ishimotonii]GBC60297.1 hypothetical protein DENIS_1248 [Desulfonema ishimotonii]